MPLKLPPVSKKTFEERVIKLRQSLEAAVIKGRSGVVARLCDAADAKVAVTALTEPEDLYEAMKKRLYGGKKPPTTPQVTALSELGTQVVITRKRKLEEAAFLSPLRREQAKNISAALVEWLNDEELSNGLVDICREKLRVYREHNPTPFIDRRSFPEILAATERDGKNYKSALETLAIEWKGADGENFTTKRFASFIMRKLGKDCGITVKEVEHWLKQPGYQIALRDKVTEAVCFVLGMHQSDEARLWRLVGATPKPTIDETVPPSEIYKTLKETSGIPAIRLLRMLDIGIDADSQIGRGEDDRVLSMEKALTLAELALPSNHWLSGAPDKQNAEVNWRLAQKLTRAAQARSFDDILLQALDSGSPHRFLINAIIGKHGMSYQSNEEMQLQWQKINPSGAYGLNHVEGLKLQNEHTRALTAPEASVVINIAKKIYPFMTRDEELCCEEILTRCPHPNKLIDQYIAQVDASGKPTEIKLKPMLERIAQREGKALETSVPQNNFLPEVTSVVYDTMRKEDRLGVRAAPKFANRLGIDGERRRKFLLRSQRIDAVDPMDIIDRTLSGELLPKQGLKQLIEQTGMSATGFGEQHGYAQREMLNWCYAGYITAPDFCQHLANDLCNPELEYLLNKTFHRHKQKDLSGIEEAKSERTNAYRSHVLRAALNIAGRKDHQR